MSGSATPSLSIRSRRIPTERSRSDFWSARFFGGTACSVTSRPPWRSSPRITSCLTGEPGTASRPTPIRPATISETRMRCGRRFTGGTGRLAALFAGRAGPELGARLVVYGIRVELVRLVGWDHRGDRPPRDLDGGPRRDFDLELVGLAETAHMAVEAAGGQDLVADLDRGVELLLRLLAARGRADQQQPEQGEHGDENDQLAQGSSW